MGRLASSLPSSISGVPCGFMSPPGVISESTARDSPQIEKNTITRIIQ